MYDLRLSAEQIEFRDTVRDFVNDVIKPVTLNAHRLDAGDRNLPMDILRQASDIGLRTLALPEALGGIGADMLTCRIIVEGLAVGDTDVAAALAETTALTRPLFEAMSPAQRERFLPLLERDGDYHLAFADREPTDETALGVNYRRSTQTARRIATTAVRSGDDVVLNGVKDCVANAPIAKLFAVEAKTDDGPALFLIPRGTPGLTVTAQGEPRWYHGACGGLNLKDCRVPADNRLDLSGRPDPYDSPLWQAVNLGIGRAAYEAALEYSQIRIQGGRAIAEHQAIGTKLADCAIRLDIARNAVWRAAWAADHPEAMADRSLPHLPLAAMSRVFVAETMHRLAKDAAECFGAMGVMRDMPMQKYLHDARICLHSGDGTADLRLRIAEALAGHRRTPTVMAAE